MTNRDAVAGVFVEEWAQLATSPQMRAALRRWRAGSNGLITATTHEELLAIIKDPAAVATSMEVSTWLLASAEPLAIRMLVQATQPVVMLSIRRAKLRYVEMEDFANSCVASLFLAAEAIAGTQTKWVIWEIRRRYHNEIRTDGGVGLLSLERLIERTETDAGHEGQSTAERAAADINHNELCPLPEGGSGEASLELTRLLVSAVNAGKISVGDAQMVWLHTIGGVSYAELSAERGIQVASIRKHQTRVVKRVSLFAESAAA